MDLLRKNIGPALLIIALIAGSCDGGSSGGCDSCDAFTIPDSLGLEIKFTIDKDNPYVPLAVYKDEVVDDAEPIFRDTVFESPVTYLLPVSESYGVRAEYTIGKTTIIAIDGDKVDYNSVSDCDHECYTYREGDVDVQLD